MQTESLLILNFWFAQSTTKHRIVAFIQLQMMMIDSGWKNLGKNTSIVNLPKTSLDTIIEQLYMGVTRRCGCFWKALRQPSLNIDIN